MYRVSVTNKSNVKIMITAIYLYKHELMLVEVKLPATLNTKLQVVESRFRRIYCGLFYSLYYMYSLLKND